MMRLIDADELTKELEKMIADYEKRMPDWSPNDYLTRGRDAAYKWSRRADGVDDALEMVKYAPTVETPQGWWEPGDVCSICGFTRYGDKFEWYNFCPGCGAEMNIKLKGDKDEAD